MTGGPPPSARGDRYAYRINLSKISPLTGKKTTGQLKLCALCGWGGGGGAPSRHKIQTPYNCKQ